METDGLEILPRFETSLVSVIMPALNEAENIRKAIRAAANGHTARDLEIVVVDGGSADDTAGLAQGQFEALRIVHSSPGRGLQMNRGAAASRGDILVFCHADTILPQGWLQAVRTALAAPEVSGGSFRPAFVPERGLTLRLLNRFRYPKNWRFIWGDQAQFTTRRIYEAVGGFREIPLMEDVEMARALRRYGKLARLDLVAKTSSRRFAEAGAVRHVVRSIWLVFNYLYTGADPYELARRYRSAGRDASR